MQRLVQSDGVSDLDAARELKIEIEIIEAQHGPNPYSNYLRKHGKRPPRADAAAIGKLLGWRVKADDGSMQPKLSKREKAAMRDANALRQAFAQRQERVQNLKTAIVTLAGIADDPASLSSEGVFRSDNPEMVADIENAVSWLNRFAEMWRGQSQKSSAEKQISSYRDRV